MQPKFSRSLINLEHQPLMHECVPLTSVVDRAAVAEAIAAPDPALEAATCTASVAQSPQAAATVADPVPEAATWTSSSEHVLPRTTKSWGITRQELDRLNDAVLFMSWHCRPKHSQLWFLTTSPGMPRSLIDEVGRRIVRLQTEYALPRHRATVFESGGGLHVHIIFIGNGNVERRLKASKVFGSTIDLQRVYDPEKLVRGYLAKERTPQAGYKREHMLGGRLSGSHRLEGGGDRVRLSRELQRDAIGAGYVRPWRRTYAKRD